jgi:hypothetical protein
MRDSPIARSTPAWNYLQSRVADLVEALEAQAAHKETGR